MALAEIEPPIARVDSLPAGTSFADEPLVARALLAIFAALAAVLVPGEAERLIDIPLTWRTSPAAGTPAATPPARADNACVVSVALWRA